MTIHALRYARYALAALAAAAVITITILALARPGRPPAQSFPPLVPAAAPASWPHLALPGPSLAADTASASPWICRSEGG